MLISFTCAPSLNVLTSNLLVLWAHKFESKERHDLTCKRRVGVRLHEFRTAHEIERITLRVKSYHILTYRLQGEDASAN